MMRRAWILAAAAVIGGCSGGASPEAPAAADVTDRVALAPDVHPVTLLAPAVGDTAEDLRMERVILALRIPAARRAALAQLLADQQDPASPRYHRWLTPAEFADAYGPSPAEVAQVTAWLAAQGLQVEEVAASRTWIDFSGTVAQLQRAFQTQVRDFQVGDRVRHANVTTPSMPRAVAGPVAGIVSLHDIPRRPMSSGLRPLAAPAYTGSGGVHYLSPIDFATIYDVSPLYAAGIDGTGQTIAVVGRTHPAASNWSAFRTAMALPARAPVVIVNGTDPGDLGANEDGEADLDVEWSGAVARNATIDFVVSRSTASTDGVDLSAQYIVNNNLAPVMTTSFGSCESQMGSAENTFYANLWSQAAAQGITSFVSSGDSGASGCDAGSATSGTGRAVNGLSSTPYNVAVGGSQFNEGAGTYWAASNGSGYSSALGYIPEVAWNESAAVSGGSGLWSTGGGASTLYAKPSWQVAPGVPADGARDVPDVSLTAASHDGYIVQTQGALYVIGGTSASSPSLAGLMALVVQKTGQRQGNANVRFYQLGQAQYGGGGAAVFHDVASGSNSVPGVTGFTAATGYDLATGLGSVDANALVTAWSGAATPDFTVGVSPAALAVVQGASGTATVTTAVSGGFSGAVSLSASGLPSGATAAFSPASIAAPGAGSAALTVSAAASTATGTYTVTLTAASGSLSHTTTLTLTVAAAGGGGTLLSDGFEGSGWSSAQVAGTGGAWSLVTSGTHPTVSPHGGSRMARFNSYTAASGSQTRLYRSAALTLPASGTVTLRFWMVHDTGYPSSNDRVQVQVSAGGGAWTSVGAAVSRYNGSTGWAQATVDLSAYRGQSIQLGFLGISAYGDNVFLDDVSVTSP
jgi:subtilase family serine protease